MIVPITSSLSGEVKTIGTARVEPSDDDFEVEFYLKPHVTMADEVRDALVKELKAIARKQREDSLKNLSIYED
jgi:hypothetical protein